MEGQVSWNLTCACDESSTYCSPIEMDLEEDQVVSFAEVSFLPHAQTSTNLSLVTVVILEQAETTTY